MHSSSNLNSAFQYETTINISTLYYIVNIMAIVKRRCVMQEYRLPGHYYVPSWLLWFIVQLPFTSQLMPS